MGRRRRWGWGGGGGDELDDLGFADVHVSERDVLGARGALTPADVRRLATAVDLLLVWLPEPLALAALDRRFAATAGPAWQENLGAAVPSR